MKNFFSKKNKNFWLSSGVLVLSSRLDFETARRHNLTVRARDPSLGLVADASLVVDVGDVNDNTPVFDAPSDVIDVELSEATVSGTVVTKVGTDLRVFIYALICLLEGRYLKNVPQKVK